MELTLTVTLIMAGLTLGHWNPLVSVCPGEGKAGGEGEFYNIYQNIISHTVSWVHCYR